MVEIIPLNDTKKWNERIRSMTFYDFYHLAEYHQLDTSGKPLLFYYKDSRISIAFPFILRNISGTDCNDVTSVYGYPGPVADTLDFFSDSIGNFHNELLTFFDSYRIVSAFSRLHPLFPCQNNLLKGLDGIENSGFTVGIDLSLPESSLYADYSHSLIYDIRKVKKKGVFLKNAETKDEIDCFTDIYRETMKRVDAKPLYFFSDEYFRQFVQTVNSKIKLAVFRDQIIAGTLYTECNGIVQIHLSGTKTEFLKWSPSKYLWDQIRSESYRNECKFLHLGGGVHSIEDGIFNFKTLFSKRKFEFKTWRHIHNKEQYQQLVQKELKGKDSEISFFPLYRS